MKTKSDFHLTFSKALLSDSTPLNHRLIQFLHSVFSAPGILKPCCCCCCCVASGMSNSVQPHRWQPIRLHHPWDSPDKNTGVGCHFLLQCMKVKSEREVAQSYPTLSDPMDGSPSGSTVPGILQARTLEWVAISFSNAWKWKVKGKSLSRIRPLATPWTAAYQAPPSMGFARHYPCTNRKKRFNVSRPIYC